MTNADRIISELRRRSNLDDDELAARIGISRQTVNQECRLLASKGVLIREHGGPRGKLVNRVDDSNATEVSEPQTDEMILCTSPADGGNKNPLSVNPTDKIRTGSYEFVIVREINPLRNSDGLIKTFYPQSRYRGAETLGSNKYGQGPFCKFKISNNLQESGVYSLVVDRDPKYIGIVSRGVV